MKGGDFYSAGELCAAKCVCFFFFHFSLFLSFFFSPCDRMTAFLGAFQALLALLASGGHVGVFVDSTTVWYRPQDDECKAETGVCVCDRSGCTTDPLPAKRARDPFGLNGSRGGKRRHMDTCVVELSCTDIPYPTVPTAISHCHSSTRCFGKQYPLS
jgi:hypothetical protein